MKRLERDLSEALKKQRDAEMNARDLQAEKDARDFKDREERQRQVRIAQHAH